MSDTNLMQTLVDALYASVMAGDSHYAHHDPKGTAGANCPACKSRGDANRLAYDVLRRAKREAGIIPKDAIQLGDDA